MDEFLSLYLSLQQASALYALMLLYSGIILKIKKIRIIMKKAPFLLYLTVITFMFFTACGNRQKVCGDSEQDSLKVAEQNIGDSYQHLNVFFKVEPTDLLEMDEDSCAGGVMVNGVAVKSVYLGKNLGDVTFMIDCPKACIDYKGKVYELVSDSDMTFCSMKAWDLDGDEEKEILVHTGDLFDLFIYQIQKGKPNLCGRLWSNFGFFVKENHDIISRLGSQGEATLSRLVDGKLEIWQEDYYYPYNE